MNSSERRLLLVERTLPDGSLQKGWLEPGEEGLELNDEGGFRKAVPIAVLDAIMRRYGKPLAEDIAPTGPTIDGGDGATLSLLRHRARYDVIARDFLVYTPPGEDPLAELATSVAAALFYMLRDRED